MSKEKSLISDNVPIEVWKYVGERRIKLIKLSNNILKTKMQNEFWIGE